MTPVSLSVVVIGLNEADNLRRCFASVRQGLASAGARVGAGEVIFVDAGSTDDSREIGLVHADCVVAFDGPTCAAAARQAGADASSGDLLLFLDGDMELAADWTAAALELLARYPRAGGLAGIRRDVVARDRGEETVRDNVYGVRSMRRAPHFGGAVLLRRSALDDVGGYDVAMPSAEEPDLHARLLSAGHFVLEVPLPFVTHHLKKVSGARARLIRAWDTRGFWRSFGSAGRHRYMTGFIRVYPYFFTGSMVHALAGAAGMLVGWQAVIGVESVAIAAFALLGRARELPLALLRWMSLGVHVPWLLGRRGLGPPTTATQRRWVRPLATTRVGEETT